MRLNVLALVESGEQKKSAEENGKGNPKVDIRENSAETRGLAMRVIRHARFEVSRKCIAWREDRVKTKRVLNGGRVRLRDNGKIWR